MIKGDNMAHTANEAPPRETESARALGLGCGTG